MKRVSASILAALLVAAVAAITAVAASADSSAPYGFTPKVPISGLAPAMPGLDLSRLHLTSSFSFGTGFGGGSSQGLQVTSLSYQFSAPLAMRVSVGNTFGARGTSGMFLEGLDLSYRAGTNAMFSVHFQNMRSPLQYGNGYYPEYGVFGRP